MIWLLATGAAPASAVEREDLIRALKATVQILVPDNNNDLYSTGSGTILDAGRGLILTNFHVIGDPDTGAYFNDEGLALIGLMPADLKGAPVVKYVARVTRADPEIDLAVLQVIGTPGNLNAKLPKNLGLTAIDRGNSDDLLPGDHLAVLGYPGLGGSTVTYTEGVVSGFLDEDGDGVYEWIKTDTEVNPGNSGGLAIDTAGEFIGVPTAGYSRADVAGKISLLRPGALALQFYESAALGSGRATAEGKTDRHAAGEQRRGRSLRRHHLCRRHHRRWPAPGPWQHIHRPAGGLCLFPGERDAHRRPLAYTLAVQGRRGADPGRHVGHGRRRLGVGEHLPPRGSAGGRIHPGTLHRRPAGRAGQLRGRRPGRPAAHGERQRRGRRPRRRQPPPCRRRRPGRLPPAGSHDR